MDTPVGKIDLRRGLGIHGIPFELLEAKMYGRDISEITEKYSNIGADQLTGELVDYCTKELDKLSENPGIEEICRIQDRLTNYLRKLDLKIESRSKSGRLI